MSNRRLVVLAGLLIFLGFVVVHSVTPWKWSQQLQTASGANAQTIYFECGALWGSGYVHGPVEGASRLGLTPCSGRGQKQLMTGLDVLIGLAGTAVVVTWRRIPLRRRPAL